jgi:hypothetical protein
MIPTGGGAVAGIVGWERLPSARGELAAVQADPDNGANVLIQMSDSQPLDGHALVPGAALSAELDNARFIWVRSADATPVRVTWSMLGCG